jgi:hypothetical protein
MLSFFCFLFSFSISFFHALLPTFFYQVSSLRTGLLIRSGPLPLPLSQNSELYWAGITDLGRAVTADSAGVVRLLLGAAAWHPVCETRAHLRAKNETFYVISVEEAEDSGAVVGVTCKTGKYPPTVPR